MSLSRVVLFLCETVVCKPGVEGDKVEAEKMDYCS